MLDKNISTKWLSVVTGLQGVLWKESWGRGWAQDPSKHRYMEPNTRAPLRQWVPDSALQYILRNKHSSALKVSGGGTFWIPLLAGLAIKRLKRTWTSGWLSESRVLQVPVSSTPFLAVSERAVLWGHHAQSRKAQGSPWQLGTAKETVARQKLSFENPDSPDQMDPDAQQSSRI